MKWHIAWLQNGACIEHHQRLCLQEVLCMLSAVSSDPTWQSIKAGDLEESPSLSPVYEELLEVVTWAVARLSLDWPAKEQEHHWNIKLDERFLQRAWGLKQRSQPQSSNREPESFPLWGLLGRKSDATMLRASGAGPLESDWPTPSLSVLDHSQFPLEIYLLTPTPTVFRDAAVSIRLVTQYLPENKAKLRGVFVERP